MTFAIYVRLILQAYLLLLLSSISNTVVEERVNFDTNIFAISRPLLEKQIRGNL